jgi:chromosomal replication initiation ATPase DnaA
MSDSGKEARAAPPAQLPLELPTTPRFERAEFLAAPSNRAALTMIEQWPDWPDRFLLLVGPPGSGKSHLCAIWSQRAGALGAPPEAIPSLEDLASAKPRAVTLDGIDSIADETALFHLMNFAIESGADLLMSARRLPRAEDVRLPDLLSRLRRAPVIEIGAPDDDLFRAVMEKLFRDRQLVVDQALVDFAALRLERSLDAARAFVRELDREALARGRRVTRALAGELLERRSGAKI